jgi:hypothetical protein
MTIDATRALYQAADTAHDYALRSLTAMLKLLEIDRHKAGWQDKLAPFAPVWAAMITAAAQDFATTNEAGVISDTLQHDQREQNGGRS